MRKLIAAAILFVVPAMSLAQTIISFKFSPALTLTKLKREQNTYSNDFRNDNPGTSASIGFCGGVNAEFPLVRERLSFSTGVWYAIKNFTLDLRTPIRPMIYNPETQSTTYMLVEKDPRYLIHYLQIPAAIKVFCNENTNGGRFYFQAGVMANFKIAEQPINKEKNYLYQLSQRANGGDPVFRSFDVSLFVSVGYQWKLKSGNALSISVAFDKGLLKQLNSIKWNSELAPIDYYFNAKLMQLSVGCHYTLIKTLN